MTLDGIEPVSWHRVAIFLAMELLRTGDLDDSLRELAQREDRNRQFGGQVAEDIARDYQCAAALLVETDQMHPYIRNDPEEVVLDHALETLRRVQATAEDQ